MHYLPKTWQRTAVLATAVTLVSTTPSALAATSNTDLFADVLSNVCNSQGGNFPVSTRDLCDTYFTLLDTVDLTGAINALAATLAPDEVPALYSSAVQLSSNQITNVSQHLRNYRLAQNSKTAEVASTILLGDYFGGTAGETSAFSRISIFIDAAQADGNKDDTRNETGYDLSSDHYTAGIDYRLSDALVGGFAYGNSDTHLKYYAGQNQTDNQTDHYIFYGSWYQNNFAVDAMLGYATGEFETRRHILDSTASGSTDNSLFYASLAGTYDFIEGAWTYGTFASFDLMDGTIDAFEEANGGGWEVEFERQDVKSQIYTMGAHASYAASFSWGVLIPYLRVDWRSELENDRDLIVGRFVQNPATGFTVTADKSDSNWFQVSIGTSAQFSQGIALFVDYEEILDYANSELRTVSAGLRLEI